MTRRVIFLLTVLALCINFGCKESKKKLMFVPSPRAMEGKTANCEFSALTLRVGNGEPVELDINGMTVQTFYGAELLRQSCNLPENWKIVERRGVSFADIFATAGIEVDNATPVNIVPRDGWDPWRDKLGSDPLKIPTFAYYRDYAYVYVGSPGLKDPSLSVDAPGNFAKDQHYPEYEGKSLCVDYNHNTVIGAAEQAAATGMEIEAGACFGSFRYKMLEKIADGEFGLIEIDPRP